MVMIFCLKKQNKNKQKKNIQVSRELKKVHIFKVKPLLNIIQKK